MRDDDQPDPRATLRADVRPFDGKAVTALFTAVAPCYTWGIGGKIATITGPDDKNDGAEWSVVLRGNRLHDVGEGDRLKVRGVLHVINHPAVVVNGVLILRWVEVRVTEQ